MTGIVLGLLAALGHSLAYLATRWFTEDRGRPLRELLVIAHVAMGVVSAAALAVLWPDGLGLQAGWLLRLTGLVGFFVVAQVSLLSTLPMVDASRVAPLLGFKTVVLAVIAVAMGQPLTGLQWLGVALAVGAAWVLNDVGGRLPWRVTGLVTLACVSYGIADTFILGTVREVQRLTGDGSVLGAPVFVAASVYTVVGVIAAAFLPTVRRTPASAWRDAMPYAAAWLLTMVVLYGAFAAVGTVLGSILQSFRGLISIALGIALAAADWHHLEQKHGWKTQSRRLGAALLMCGAVALYVLGGR
ncbi:MAG: EamA family transporter [Planctomycetota bacterium]